MSEFGDKVVEIRFDDDVAVGSIEDCEYFPEVVVDDGDQVVATFVVGGNTDGISVLAGVLRELEDCEVRAYEFSVSVARAKEPAS